MFWELFLSKLLLGRMVAEDLFRNPRIGKFFLVFFSCRARRLLWHASRVGICWRMQITFLLVNMVDLHEVHFGFNGCKVGDCGVALVGAVKTAVFGC